MISINGIQGFSTRAIIITTTENEKQETGPTKNETDISKHTTAIGTCSTKATTKWEHRSVNGTIFTQTAKCKAEDYLKMEQETGNGNSSTQLDK